MPSSQVAQAIAQGHTAVYPQAHLADNDSLSASPTTLTFSSLEPRNVTVTVDKPTTVYAGSADTTIATVSPSEQTLGASKGGKLTFAVTPTTTHPAITFICFLDSDWQVACVTVTIQNRKPTPTPQPTPTTVPSPTAAPTAIPTFRFPSAAPSESPSPSPTPTPSPIIIITPPPVPTAPPPTTIPVATPTPTPAPTQPPLH